MCEFSEKSSVAGLEVLSQIILTGSTTKLVSSPCCVHSRQFKVTFQFQFDFYLNVPKKVHEIFLEDILAWLNLNETIPKTQNN